MALLSQALCSRILGVALFGYAVLLIFIPKLFWGLYFDNIEDFDMLNFISRFVGSLFVGFGSAGVFAPDCTGTAITMITFLFTSFMASVGVPAGFYGDNWTWLWYPQIFIQIVFLSLAVMQYSGSAGVAAIPSGTAADGSKFTQININKFLAVCFIGYAVLMVGTPTEFLGLYWDEPMDLVVSFCARIGGLSLLALGAAGILDPGGKGPSIAFAVGNCVSTLFFLFIFVGVYGDKWTALWYPQIFINAGFGYLGVMSYLKMAAAAAAGDAPAAPGSNPRLSAEMDPSTM